MENFPLSFAGFETTWDHLPDNSKKALAILGFSTKIKNAIAGVKAGVLGTSKDPWTPEEVAEAAQDAGLSTWGNDDATANAIAAFLQSRMFEAILSGVEPSTRGRKPAMTDEEKLRRECAIFVLEAIAKEQKKPLPKRSKKEDKDAFEELLARALASTKPMASGKTFAQTVDAEVAARKRNAAKMAGGEELDFF